MKYLLMIALAFWLISTVGCAGIELEGLKYNLSNGKVATCVTHPTREGYMQCSYMDKEQEIVFAIKRNMISGGK